MAKKGNLFLLIRSLSKSEKRYFRLTAFAVKKNAIYLRLFDFLDNQEVADDDLIRAHFKDASFTKQLHVTKIYLTELILKSLRNYHAGDSVNSQLLDLLRDIDLLFRRELYDLCHYKLLKAEKLATEYEKGSLLLEVLSWKRRLQLAQSPQGAAATRIIFEAEKKTLEGLDDLHTYWNLTTRMFERDDPENFLKTVKSGKASTLQAKMLRHYILYSHYFMNGKLVAAEKEISHAISYVEEFPARIADDPSPYITAIGNKIGLLLSQKRWKEIHHLIGLMRTAPERYKLASESKFTVRLWLRIFNLELEVYRDTKELHRATALVNEIEDFLDAHKNAVPDNYRIMLYYQIASIYFLGNEFSKSLQWTNHILNHNFGELRNDLQCYGRILNLLIHFELNNIMVLRYSVDSARRFFKKKKNNNFAEQAALRLFSRLSQAETKQYQEIFSKSYEELYDNPKETATLQDYIDLRSWLEHKMTHKKK